jgi:diguanylate cyclase (GGDEF)-like protein/PAS domain S-box-containing protein
MAKAGTQKPGVLTLRSRNDGGALVRNVVENAFVPTFLANAGGALVYANRAFASLLGYEPEELLGLNLKAIVHPEDAPAARAQMKDLLARRIDGYRAERRYLRKDGNAIWVLASAAALIDEETGSLRQVTVQAIDIDGQKRAEADLIETEHRWNSALEAAGQGVWDHDVLRGRVFYSRMWRLIRGFGPDEEVDSSTDAWLSRIHPDDRERILSLTRRQDSGEIPYTAFEYRERHAEGHYVWILSRGGPVEWFPDGKPSRFVGTDTDITSLKKAEEELQFANTLLKTQMETSLDAILVVDANAKIISFNRRFAEMWNIPLDLLHGEDDAPVLAAVSSSMPDPQAFAARVEYFYAHPEAEGHDQLETTDGRVVDRHTAALRASGGKYLGRIWFFRDITEEIRQAKEKELQNFRFEAALNNMTQGLCMFDRDERLVVSNCQYAQMYGLSPEDVHPGMLLDDLLQQRLEAGNQPVGGSHAFVTNRLAAVSEGQATAFAVELTDGRTISIRHKPLPDGGWVATHEDVTEQRRNQARVQHLARHDALTDLPNRVLFQEHMAEVNLRVQKDEIVSVLCIDLDGFKGVNDTLGHAIGDAVLKDAAVRLREITRDTDMVARLGGDEFAVVEGGLEQVEDAAALAGRIVKIMAQPFDVEGHHIVIGASVGIAVAPLDGNDGGALMKHADLALYRAKQDGRGTYHFYEKSLDAALQERRSMETALRSALPGNEFRLVFQPLLNLAENRVCSFEALLRWEHPEHGYMQPSQFIPVAEESGLIVPIGAWVLREACMAAARWPGDVGVSVNLSPVQFRKNRNLVEHVKAALSSSGLRAERLEVEITETVLLADNESALQTLRQLKDLGVRVAMDDFGTGYSSLSYLRRFPFDKIKIDQSFVQDSSSSADSLAIVKAVIGLGRSLGMTTTAEGVETEAQLSMIREQGCTEVQGFLLSAPLPASAVSELLSRFGARDAPGAMRSRETG